MLVKDKARNDAARVLRDTWLVAPPVDPERIAAHFPNMRITRLPLESGISGMLQVEGDFAEIFVNSADSPERQRFTIAHEIGHYFERTSRGVIDFNVIDYRSTKAENYDLHEFYADEFAGHLLMPETELRRVLAEGMPLPLIAAHFQVSLPAARQRMKRMELFGES